MAKTSEHRILNALHYLFTHRDDKIVAHCFSNYVLDFRLVFAIDYSRAGRTQQCPSPSAKRKSSITS